MISIVTAKEMARIEKLALDAGKSELEFVETVGRKIAERLCHLLSKQTPITLLAGKGNNGADAYSVGFYLTKLGFSVTAYSAYPIDALSPCCRQMHDRLAGVTLVHSASKIEWKGVILDGLLGTGFQGKLDSLLEKVISLANASELPIYAIDIPSGLNGNTGEVSPIAIKATRTFYLELPKLGFFLKQGWDHVGHLERISFGLEDHEVEKGEASALLFSEKDVCLPKIQRSRHKYQAGYVLSVAGSYLFPGAALLASYAALKSGAGIVRLFHPHGMELILSQSPWELIREGWDLKNPTRILEEAKRAKAILIGPGLGQTQKMKRGLQKLLANLEIPTVLDADALYFLSLFPSWKLPEKTVLTPHHQEMQRLFPFDSPLECQEYVDRKKIVLVLKGAPTWIFAPRSKPTLIAAGNPGMATAGSGDVLTGMITSLIAQGLSPLEAAKLGCFLHGKAGECAASKLTPYSMVASDLIEHFPEAFRAGNEKK